MNKKLYYWIFPLICLGLVACAQSQIEKDIDNQMASQPLRPMQGGVALKGLESIESSSFLNAEQKLKMRELHVRMMKETFENQEKTSKLKSVLFETITTAPYNKEKVNVIKRRLVDLNTKKLSNMFNALDEVEKIIGYSSGKEKEDYYNSMMKEIFSIYK